jgi:hypothetical protein
MIEKIPGESLYTNFAYHVALLQDFGGVDFGPNSVHSTGRRRVSYKERKLSIRRSGSFGNLKSHQSLRPQSARVMTDSARSNTPSVRSGGSLRGASRFGFKANSKDRANATYSGGQSFSSGGARRV